jgi:hypothetical protein
VRVNGCPIHRLKHVHAVAHLKQHKHKHKHRSQMLIGI